MGSHFGGGMTVEGTWNSSLDGTEHPSGWRMDIAEHGLALRITPVIDDQELTLSFRYWEGAVRVSGSVRGRGYVELTGY